MGIIGEKTTTFMACDLCSQKGEVETSSDGWALPDGWSAAAPLLHRSDLEMMARAKWNLLCAACTKRVRAAMELPKYPTTTREVLGEAYAQVALAGLSLRQLAAKETLRLSDRINAAASHAEEAREQIEYAITVLNHAEEQEKRNGGK